MKSLNLMHCLIALCVAGASRPAFGDPHESPDSVTPKLVVIKEISKLEGRISCEWREIERGSVEKVRVRRADGQIVEPRGDAYIVNGKTLFCDDLDFYDQKGNRLTQDTFLARVKLGDTVLISENGKAPDAQYLRIFKNDVLIISETQRVQHRGATFAPPRQSK